MTIYIDWMQLLHFSLGMLCLWLVIGVLISLTVFWWVEAWDRERWANSRWFMWRGWLMCVVFWPYAVYLAWIERQR
jgi:hypothetical protein